MGFFGWFMLGFGGVLFGVFLLVFCLFDCLGFWGGWLGFLCLLLGFDGLFFSLV